MKPQRKFARAKPPIDSAVDALVAAHFAGCDEKFIPEIRATLQIAAEKIPDARISAEVLGRHLRNDHRIALCGQVEELLRG